MSVIGAVMIVKSMASMSKASVLNGIKIICLNHTLNMLRAILFSK